jgi:thioredoxin-related protein
MRLKKFLASAACVGAIASALAPSFAMAGGEGWSHDMTAAMKQAKEEKKDLLLDFTGSDWCGWCIKLNEEVFSQDAFKSDAPNHFVLVELDFPNDKSKLSEETQKQNEEWGQKLSVRGYPTIFLADEQGRPYAQTGYQAGGAETYVAHLAELREKRVARDEAFAAAEKAKGVDKAKQLDAAMDVVGEDLALNVYGDQVKEIIKLDAKNEAGLKAKYEQKLNGVEFDKAVAGIQGAFDGQNAADLLTQLDAAVEKFKPDAGRLAQVTMMKVHFLGVAEKHEEAIALIDTLLADDSQEMMIKLQLGLAKANALKQLDRADDALKAVDAVIALAPAENDLKARVTVQKAMMMVDMGKTEEAVKVFDEAAEAATNPGLKAQIGQIKEQLTAKPDAAAEESSGK